jgi:hypothetical protein
MCVSLAYVKLSWHKDVCYWPISSYYPGMKVRVTGLCYFPGMKVSLAYVKLSWREGVCYWPVLSYPGVKIYVTGLC